MQLVVRGDDIEVCACVGVLTSSLFAEQKHHFTRVTEN